MAELVKDVVCGMEVDPDTAPAKSEYQGVTYYFCAEGCKQDFDANPQKYLNGGAPAAEQPAEVEKEQPAEVPAAASTSTEEQPRKRWWEFWKS